jgi:hypothetical protein
VELGGGLTTTVLRDEPQADKARQASMAKAIGRMAIS